ncbi:hypothetical protein AB0F72_08540 [Actinoplanes sp. NPDC023936]|uniref:hypothetical protein n=1 Tax=Actinoplanes sp. NPDC023936 TaxID=3154910 RepID=UPI0033F24577
MNNWGALLAAIGQTVELVGVVWLLIAAWRDVRQPSSYNDVLNIRERISAGGYGPAAITVATGLLIAVLGSWLQV